MSIYNTDLAGLCEDLVVQLSDLQGENSQFKLGKKNGILDFLVSPENVAASGAEITSLSDANGKLKTARVVYKPQQAESVIVTDATAEAAGLCDSNVEPEPLETTVKIDSATSFAAPLGFSNNKMKEYCQDSTLFMKDFLDEYLRLGREKLNQQILAQVEAGIGINYEEDGSTTAAGAYKSVDILNADGTPRYQGIDEIIGDYENNNLNGMPAVIGQGNIAKFYRLEKLVCCNDSVAFPDVETGISFFKDQHSNSVLGANQTLVIAPGATQLITYNENAHIDIDEPLARHIVVPDPVYGNALKWDLDFKWDECNKKWVWFARVYFRVFNTFQPDGFPSGSPLGDRNGMTGIFGYTAAVAS
jgi:hypothetical protein